MGNKVYGDVEPRCEYCEFGTLTPAGDKVLCVKKGIFDPGFSCRKFSYDPLKKIPGRAPVQQEFSPEDFTL